jgi:hypothetical protein
VIFAEDLFYYDYDLKAITIGGWKLVHSRNRFHDPVVWNDPDKLGGVYDPGELGFAEGDELYNLNDDPYERRNVIYEHPDIARYLRDRLNLILYFEHLETGTRMKLEGEMTYFGAGLKNLTRGYGYW